jgi:aquaporin Z
LPPIQLATHKSKQINESQAYFPLTKTIKMNFRKLIAEFIGTFFLTLTVCMVAYSKVSADLQPLAIGVVLTGLIYAGGYISGAIFNPAVTVAILLRGRLNVKEAGSYMAAQFLGGIAAALLTMVLTSAKNIVFPIVSPPQYFGIVPAVLAELLGAFALVWVVLNVATSKSTENNSYYGLSIGFTLAGLIYTLGGVSGSAFNPAVALATTVAQLGNWANLWIYLVGGFGGAVLAGVVYKFVNPEE